MHERLDDPELLAVPLRELPDRAVEDDVEALAELVAELLVHRAAQPCQRLELLATGESVGEAQVTGQVAGDRRAATPFVTVSRPWSDARPAVGRMSPRSRRIVVDFPAPFGPR